MGKKESNPPPPPNVKKPEPPPAPPKKEQKSRKNLVRPGKNGGMLTNGGAMENAGRPPKLLKHLNLELKAKGYEPVKPSQITEAFETLLNLPKEEIEKLKSQPGIPYFVQIICGRLISKESDNEALEKLLDRAIGRPRQSIDHTSGGEKIAPTKFEGVTISELEKEFEARGLPKPNIDSLRG